MIHVCVNASAASTPPPTQGGGVMPRGGMQYGSTAPSNHNFPVNRDNSTLCSKKNRGEGGGLYKIGAVVLTTYI